jgi:hypothetical protein
MSPVSLASSAPWIVVAIALSIACQSAAPASAPVAAAPGSARQPPAAPEPSPSNDTPQAEPATTDSAAAPAPAPSASTSAAAEQPTTSDEEGSGFGSSEPGRLSTPSGLQYPPRIRLGKLTVIEGREDEHVLTRGLRRSFGRYRLCYERALAKKAKLEGRFTFRFGVRADGTLANVAKTSTDLADAAMVDCLVRAVSGVQIEARDRGTVVVEASLVFLPGD